MQVGGADRHDVVAVDDPPVVVDGQQAVGVAVEGEAEVGAARPTTAAASESRCVAPHRSLMLRPSGVLWMATTSAPAAANSARGDGAGGAVGAVDDDAQPGEVAALEGVDAGGRRSRASPRRRAAGPARRVGGGRSSDLALDALLDLVGQLDAAAGEQLDAVVAVRVVRGRDHRPDGVAPARPRRPPPASARRRGGGRRRPRLPCPATNAASSIAVDTRVSPPTTASTPSSAPAASTRAAARPRSRANDGGQVGVGDPANTVGPELHVVVPAERRGATRARISAW